MALSNREFYQRHGLLSAERIEQPLDIEDAARNLVAMHSDVGEVFQEDINALNVPLELVPLQ